MFRASWTISTCQCGGGAHWRNCWPPEDGWWRRSPEATFPCAAFPDDVFVNDGSVPGSESLPERSGTGYTGICDNYSGHCNNFIYYFFLKSHFNWNLISYS